MTVNTTEAALKEDFRLGLTPEVLFEEYIVKDRGLQDLADQFSVGVKKIRGALKRAGIQKSAEQIRSKVSRIGKQRTAVTSNFHEFSTEQRQTAQIKSTEARKANRFRKLQEKGLTEARLQELYIDENRSLKELEGLLNLTRKELRNILKLYGIVKGQEHRDLARSTNLGSFYEDPEKVLAMNLKRHETIRELYGRSWYRKTTSKEENALRDALQERHPTLKIIQSDWSTIRRAFNGAQLQLDFLIPELKLALEYNGEYYHDRDRYEASLRGECDSPELEKLLLCEAVGVKLIHVWSSDWKVDPAAVLQEIDRHLA